MVRYVISARMNYLDAGEDMLFGTSGDYLRVASGRARHKYLTEIVTV